MPNSLTAPPARNLIIVCVEDHPKSIRMLRIARKRAQEKNGRWRAVFIENGIQNNGKHDSAHERMLRLMTLAEQMGGETARVDTEDMENGLGKILAREAANIALVIVGSVEAEGRFKYFRTYPWMRLVRLASMHTQVEIIPLSGHYYRSSWREKLNLRAIRPKHLLYSLLAIGTASLCTMLLEWLLPPALFRINNQNVALIFMIACAFTAGRFGLLPGLVASVGSFLTVNYYFTMPYHALKLNSITDFLNMVLFLSAALLISLFTSQTRGNAQRAAKRELNTQALFTLYRVAADAFSREQALEQLQSKLETMLEMEVAFFLPDTLTTPRASNAPIYPACPSKLVLQENDRKALDVAWSEMKTTGLASPFNPGTKWRFEPMISSNGEIGVVGIRPHNNMQLDAWFGKLLSDIADQTATVLEHIELERSMGETRISEEREKLRSMLLSSVSHDLKTPLAGIIGALSVYRSQGERLAPAKREELIEAAMGEAQRLDSFITNILDMTRLESGNIRFRMEWHDMNRMVRNVLKHLQHRIRHHEITVHPFPDNVEVSMDIMMTEQVLQNVLDNALKYTPPGTHIEISSWVDESQGVLCEIRDNGKGIPAEKLERVFDKYARLQKTDSQVAGTGLGLAISKAVMKAQGGWITAANHAQGGAVFTFCLPQWRKVTNEQAQGAIL